MERLKSMLKCALIVAVFFVFSNFLINVGLNSTYKDIKREDNNPLVVVYQADATYVNGRIRGLIKNASAIQDKYLEVELYSARDVLMGRSYIEIDTTKAEQPFEILFRAKDVKTYKIATANEKKEGHELEILPKEWTKPEILLVTAMTFFIFWA